MVTAIFTTSVTGSKGRTANFVTPGLFPTPSQVLWSEALPPWRGFGDARAPGPFRSSPCRQTVTV